MNEIFQGTRRIRSFPLLAALAALGFAGCATPYQPLAAGGGYAETLLAPDTYRVSFEGNVLTTPGRCHDLALLRAAELCLMHGFSHFAIVNSQQSVKKTETFSTPASTQTTGYVYGYGNMTTYTQQTTHNPGTSFHMEEPRAEILIRCYRCEPENFAAFDAASLQESLKRKHHVP